MSGSGDSERQLLREISMGSLEAFDRFYERYVPMMYRVAIRLTGDRMDAEDVCHDVLTEMIRRPEQFDPARGSLEAWLVVKTKSRSMDALRRRSRSVQTDMAGMPLVDHGPLPDEAALARADAEAVRAALRDIPALQRDAVYGAFYESMTHRELAERMNRPLGTVKSLVRYGLNNVRKKLGSKGWIEPAKGGQRHESS